MNPFLDRRSSKWKERGPALVAVLPILSSSHLNSNSDICHWKPIVTQWLLRPRFSQGLTKYLTVPFLPIINVSCGWHNDASASIVLRRPSSSSSATERQHSAVFNQNQRHDGPQSFLSISRKISRSAMPVLMARDAGFALMCIHDLSRSVPLLHGTRGLTFNHTADLHVSGVDAQLVVDGGLDCLCSA